MVHDPSSRAVARRPPGPVGRWLTRWTVRTGLAFHYALTRLARATVRQRAPRDEALDILLTGTFHSADWISAHLRPLAASRRCRRVRMVASTMVPDLPNVEPVAVPRWLRRAIGNVPARLVVFAWVAARSRPDIVGGFHLLVNGLAAQLVAAGVGARALYFSCGGPTELLGGGASGENPYFARLGAPDAVAERQLLRAVRDFDLVITMGSRASRFFRDRGARGAIHTISGGIDGRRFRRRDGRVDFDVIFVGRLVPIKRVDRLLHALRIVADVFPGVTAVVVGDGPLREPLLALARDLGIADRVAFVGRQAAVERWLHRAGIFVLTSASEGLSLSLMEAMSCGLPAVVPEVGDLADLVDDGVNGFVVRDSSPEQFAQGILSLLRDSALRRRFSAAAERAAASFDPRAVAAGWDAVLAPMTAVAREPRPHAESATRV